MKNKRYGDFKLGYIDFLTATVGVFAVLIMMAMALIAIAKKENEGIKKNAQFVFTATWSEKIDCDVDIWVRDPNNVLISYKHPEGGVTYIERDDMGHRRDMTYVNQELVLVNPENKEYATVRGIIPGEWIVNIHLYSCQYVTDTDDTGIAEPIGFKPGTPYTLPVSIEIIKINPDYETVYETTMEFTSIWQELTALKFRVNERGFVSDKTTDYISIRPNTVDTPIQ
jgi:hypothetical protein